MLTSKQIRKVWEMEQSLRTPLFPCGTCGLLVWPRGWKHEPDECEARRDEQAREVRVGRLMP
jgi:hypothetical protein